MPDRFNDDDDRDLAEDGKDNAAPNTDATSGSTDDLDDSTLEPGNTSTTDETTEYTEDTEVDEDVTDDEDDLEYEDLDDEDWSDEDDDLLAFLDDDDYEITDLDDDDYEITDLDDEDDTEVDDAAADEAADDIGEDGTDETADPNLVRKLRNENAARRKKFNEFREQSVAAVEQGIGDFATQLAGTLGIQVEGDLTPDAVTNAVAQQVSTLADEVAQARRDLAIFRAAGPAGADMNKLADSKAFTDRVDELDPNSDGYQADVAKAVSAALEANPHFKAAPKIDRVGGDFSGGTTPAISDASVESFAEQRRKRRGITID